MTRNYESWDQSTIREWHQRSGFDYVLPHFQTENFAAKKVVVDGVNPVAAATARVIVEIYGFTDPNWGTPGMRLAALRMLHEEIAKEMRAQNIKTAISWLPPQIGKSFARRLKKAFGWLILEDNWQCVTKDI